MKRRWFIPFLFSKHRADISKKRKKNHVDYGNACDELSVLTSWALRVNSACFFSLYFPAVCCPHSHSPASRTRRYSVSVAEAALRSVSCLFHTPSRCFTRKTKRKIWSDGHASTVESPFDVCSSFSVVRILSGDNPFFLFLFSFLSV